MSIEKSTIRPGLLVNMKTSLSGNQKYSSTAIEDKVLDDGSQFRKWEGTTRVFDPEEQKAATKVRSKASGLITSACAYTAFGLLCPEDNIQLLEEAILAARKMVDDFNRTAKFTYIRLNLLCGRIASDDVEALRTINGEIRDLMETMEKGIEERDVKAIRDAAYKARMMGQMLTPQMQEEVKKSIADARAAATKYASKAGDAASLEVDRDAAKRIASRRTLFLNLDEQADVAAPKAVGRAVAVVAAEEAKPERKASSKPRKPATVQVEGSGMPKLSGKGGGNSRSRRANPRRIEVN